MAFPEPETGAAFTRKQLRDQVATRIVAGHETTAITLFWSLLSARPRSPLAGRDRRRLPPQNEAYVKALNKLYVEQPALHQVDFSGEGFQWIDFHDVDQGVVSFLRRAHDPADIILAAANFTPVPREGYRLGVPGPGFYSELLNSDFGLLRRR